jgi:hypothetical protein
VLPRPMPSRTGDGRGDTRNGGWPNRPPGLLPDARSVLHPPRKPPLPVRIASGPQVVFQSRANGHGTSPYGRRDPELREWNEVDKIALSDVACTFGNVDEAIGGAKT